MLGKIFKRFRKIDDDIIIAHASPVAVPTLIGVVGDVHGCTTLTAKLIDKLRDNHPDIKLLFVGDYIDHGEESRQVIELLMGMPEVTCLMGNHERMCLDFLAEPEERGGRWLRNGGLQTVASYGFAGSQTELTKMRDALALAMGDKVINDNQSAKNIASSPHDWMRHSRQIVLIKRQKQSSKSLLGARQ